MKTTLSKRLTFFTNINLLLLAIAVVVCINRSDSQENISQFDSLTSLKIIQNVDITGATPYIRQRALWIVRYNDRTFSNEELNLSSRFSKIMASYGLRQEELEDPSLRYDKGQFSLVNVVPNPTKDSLIGFAQWAISKTPDQDATVGHLFSKAEYLGADAKIRVVTHFDELRLKHLLDSICFLKQSERRHLLLEKDSNRIKRDFYSQMTLSIHIDDTLMFLILADKEKESSNNISLEELVFLQIEISSRISTVSSSLGSLMDISNIWFLSNESPENDDLKKNFSNVNITRAIDYFSEESMRSYKSVSIFGFDFSRKRLPLALEIFSLIASIGIYMVIKRAKNSSLKIITGVEDEHATHMLLESIWSRSFLWCVSPFIALYLTVDNISLILGDNLTFFWGGYILQFSGKHIAIMLLLFQLYFSIVGLVKSRRL